MKKNRFIYIGLLFLLGACSIFSGKKDELLAEVYNEKLYASEVLPFIPDNASKEDSFLVMKDYVNRWVKETVVLHEAEKHIPEDVNIDVLVENYRSSLIRNYYEQSLLDEIPDSTLVTGEQVRSFYESNKAQYVLETPIVRAYIIKLARSVDKPERFNRWWENCRKDSASYRNLQAFCNAYAEVDMLEDSTWYSVKDLEPILPEDAITESNIRTKKDFTQRDDNYEYFYKSFDIINKRGIAPLSYIEDQARRFLLQQRKQEFLKEKREEAYEKGLKRRNIQVYTD
ncbi:MAG: hypothetical protein AAFP82_02035 [Bacteroidota bacterium]